MDDKCYWKKEDYNNGQLHRMPFTLPSCCSLKDELLLFKAGFTDSAQELKDKSMTGISKK